MGKLTISKGEMKRYLASRIVPSLGPEWHVHDATTVYRCADTMVIQGIHFDRSSHANRFSVWYFVLPLCPATDTLGIGLGDRLRDREGREIWFDWEPTDASQTDRLMTLCLEQAKPPISARLTVEVVGDLLAERAERSDGGALWYSAILSGLLGRQDQARRGLEATRLRVLQTRKEWSATSGDVPPHIDQQLAVVRGAQEALADGTEAFRIYCRTQAEATITALRLVTSSADS